MKKDGNTTPPTLYNPFFKGELETERGFVQVKNFSLSQNSSKNGDEFIKNAERANRFNYGER